MGFSIYLTKPQRVGFGCNAPMCEKRRGYVFVYNKDVYATLTSALRDG